MADAKIIILVCFQRIQLKVEMDIPCIDGEMMAELSQSETNLKKVLDSGNVGKTMLTEYFVTCSNDAEARELSYSEFPHYYVWDMRTKTWNERRKRHVIGRLNSTNPTEGERYYLRVLPLHVRGAVSFDDLLTVGGQTCFSFKEAAQRKGLLESDRSNFECLNEAMSFHMPNAFRRLFATLLVYCEPSDVKNLWDSFYEHFSDGFARDGVVGDVEVLCETLRSVNYFLESMGKNSCMYDLPKIPSLAESSTISGCREIMDEMCIPLSAEDLVAHLHLNTGQRVAYDLIMDCLENARGGLFFVSGSGGTGKTFLYRALLSTVRSRSMIALATATSGVAASILPRGRTAHSRFKIPIDLHENSFCSISKQSGLAELLRRARLIVWDETPMCKRFAIEAVDRTLQDLVGKKEPFGGKVVVLGGDFMQVLPVIPKATVQETIDGSLIKSYLFHLMHIIVLSENMRAREDPVFCNFLLRVGQGIEPMDEHGNIKIPDDMLIRYCEEYDDLSEQRLISYVYPSLTENYSTTSYMKGRAILATKNVHVDRINKNIISLFPGEEMIFLSFDEAIDDTQKFYPDEFLNSLTSNGLLPHRLVLKKNYPIMLLRNLDPPNGLCNGTRMVCRDFRNNVIHGEITVGHHTGKMVLIPRIPLSAAENEGYPFQFRRKQFPIRLCFAMTINKSQGQTLPIIRVYLPEPVFSHGQLYVAISRGISMRCTKVLIKPDTYNANNDTLTKNVVYREALDGVV
ncbi:uncharacterized protein [Primulina huaijiensis]|uniref:uncharacterized protein n=1 Tax=Primulina huaijiensis TaxID=1492673 RepID=UPI003CC704C7